MFVFAAKNRQVEWRDDLVLNTQEEVDKYIEDGGFVKNSTNHSDDGETIYYRCKSMPKAQAKNCLRMKVFKPISNLKFIVTQSVGEHDHSSVVSKRQQKSPELWNYIYGLKYEDRMKPRKIKEHLKRNRNVTLTIRQIRHILKTMEQEKIPSTISFGELIEWLKSQQKLPENVDDAFVVGYSFVKQDSSFAFLISTRRLLRNAVQHDNLSADGTYKIIWQGFPLIVVGSIDREKHFHVVAIVVTSNERKSEYEFVFRTIKEGVEAETKQAFQPNIIVSDHAAAIRNGFFAVFGPSKNVICCIHLFRKLREKSSFSNAKNKQNIRNDVFVLHSAPDEETFDHAVLLFLEKWQKTDDEFCTYFKSTWLGETTRNWYTGYSSFVPAHNNGVVIYFFVRHFPNIII